MNNYPVWWDTTLTLYNKYQDPVTDLITWHRTVLPNCFWKYGNVKVKVGDTIIETNQTVVRIPKNEKFLERYEWVKLPNDEMSNYFTLWNGDILIKGEVEDEIDEYSNGKRATDMLAKYKELQGCIVAEYVTINTGLGRGNEHYHISGV